LNIQDKVIAITGAAQGFGRAFALDLSERGAKLALIDVNDAKLEETRRLCEERNAQCIAYKADVSKERQIIGVFENLVGHFGALDVLVNNAGIIRDGTLLKVDKRGEIGTLSFQDWQQVIDVNLTGVFLCTREAAFHMARLGQPGVIVNLSSICRAGNRGQSNYSAAKAGVASMTVTWAKELADFQIRVAAIAPGFMQTEMVESLDGKYLEQLLSSIPLRSFGTVEQITRTLRFILKNDYITGRVIEVDGGLRI